MEVFYSNPAAGAEPPYLRGTLKEALSAGSSEVEVLPESGAPSLRLPRESIFPCSPSPEGAVARRSSLGVARRSVSLNARMLTCNRRRWRTGQRAALFP